LLGTQELVATIRTLTYGNIPAPVFGALCEQFVFVAVEMIVTNSAGQILLLPRDPKDAYFPGEPYHLLGTMLLTGTLEEALKRVIEREIGTEAVMSEPVKIGAEFIGKGTAENQSVRGAELGFLHHLRVDEKLYRGKGIFASTDALPGNMICFHRSVLIPAGMHALGI